MLTGEEEDVARALREYTADPEQVHPADFVPTSVLYQAYRDYVGQFTRYPDDPATLNTRQFGAALLRVFPDLDEWDEDLKRNPNRVQRRYHGKKKWGYLGVKGPLSIRTQDEPGRPRRDPLC
jgi:hypothetical protein